MKDRKKCEKCARRISVIGVLTGVLLASFKLTVGFMGRSRALIASGMCNLSDISSSFAVMLGVKYSKKNPNMTYQYGYGKMEFVVQVIVSALMILGNVVLILSSFIVIAQKRIIVPHFVVFCTAIISAIINGLIYKFAHCGSKELNSPALKSHAEHNKIDIISSLMVCVGVIATRFGLHWADPLIAIIEALHVIHGSWVIFWEGFKGLMDTSVTDEFKGEIKHSAMEVNRVDNVKRILARQSGQKIYVDLTVALNPTVSVVESKKIVQDLRANLRKKYKYLGSIMVQIVPTQTL